MGRPLPPSLHCGHQARLFSVGASWALGGRAASLAPTHSMPGDPPVVRTTDVPGHRPVLVEGSPVGTVSRLTSCHHTLTCWEAVRGGEAAGGGAGVMTSPHPLGKWGSEVEAAVLGARPAGEAEACPWPGHLTRPAAAGAREGAAPAPTRQAGEPQRPGAAGPTSHRLGVCRVRAGPGRGWRGAQVSPAPECRECCEQSLRGPGPGGSGDVGDLRTAAALCDLTNRAGPGTGGPGAE